MSSPRLEAFLALLYTDHAALARFLADPDAEARRAGLDVAEREAVANMDVTGLGFAARSFAHKRAGMKRRKARSWYLRWLPAR